MRQFFSPEDLYKFQVHLDKLGYISREDCRIIANSLNAKIEREAKVVYGSQKEAECWFNYRLQPTYTGHKIVELPFQALLIDIKPVQKPCDHPMEKLTQSTPGSFICICECGAKVRPTSFAVVE